MGRSSWHCGTYQSLSRATPCTQAIDIHPSLDILHALKIYQHLDGMLTYCTHLRLMGVHVRILVVARCAVIAASCRQLLLHAVPSSCMLLHGVGQVVLVGGGLLVAACRRRVAAAGVEAAGARRVAVVGFRHACGRLSQARQLAEAKLDAD